MNLPPNRFLQSISPADFELLRPHLRSVKLPHAEILFDQGDIIKHVYFPIGGVVSFVVPLADGQQIEAGMIGKDGVVGTPAALDGAKSLNRAIVQVAADEALMIDLVHIKAAVAASRTLRLKLYQYDQLLLAQAQQSAACNAVHEIEARLCRWILRTRDLVESDTLNLTQEFLAQMLGVRRTSVTLAARHLQAVGFIKYRRGRIQILDQEGLEEAACECYQAVRTQHARMLSDE